MILFCQFANAIHSHVCLAKGRKTISLSHAARTSQVPPSFSSVFFPSSVDIFNILSCVVELFPHRRSHCTLGTTNSADTQAPLCEWDGPGMLSLDAIVLNIITKRIFFTSSFLINFYCLFNCCPFLKMKRNPRLCYLAKIRS